MAATSTQTLFTEAACFSCLGAVGAVQTMRIALLSRTLEALDITMTAQELIDEGACYLCLPGVSLADTVELALIDQISQNISGGGGDVQIFSGNYGGGTPTDTPTTSAAMAYDLDDPFTTWKWDGSAWT